MRIVCDSKIFKIKKRTPKNRFFKKLLCKITNVLFIQTNRLTYKISILKILTSKNPFFYFLLYLSISLSLSLFSRKKKKI